MKAVETYKSEKQSDVYASNFIGMRVYGSNDEDVGEIDQLILSDDGKQIQRVVLDVGGFLGIGEHEVAVTMDELRIIRAKEGDDFRAYVDVTQEELEAQPKYEN